MVTREEVLEAIDPYWVEGTFFRTLSIEDGWLQLVYDLIQDVVAVDPGVRVTQVKEKFGTLAFYAFPAGDWEAARELIAAAEAKSMQTCEVCGGEGQLGNRGGGDWWRTLCDKDAPEGWTAFTEDD